MEWKRKNSAKAFYVAMLLEINICCTLKCISNVLTKIVLFEKYIKHIQYEENDTNGYTYN